MRAERIRGTRGGKVGFTRKLYDRFRHLIHELAKFGVVGAIAFVVTDGGTNLLHVQEHVGPLTSNVAATAVATVVSFVGNRWWTFRHRERTSMRRETIMFFVLNGVGLVIQLACIGFTYYALGYTDHFSYNIALLFGIALGTLFRFWSYRKWVWAAPPAAALPQSRMLVKARPARSEPRHAAASPGRVGRG
jgi:putative flippase GtrA